MEMEGGSYKAYLDHLDDKDQRQGQGRHDHEECCDGEDVSAEAGAFLAGIRPHLLPPGPVHLGC